MKSLRLLFLLIVLVSAGWCAPASANASAPAGAETDPGRRVYVSKCAKCHKFYDPAKYSDQAWERWMGKMTKKAKLKPAEAEQVSRYIKENLRRRENAQAQPQAGAKP